MRTEVHCPFCGWHRMEDIQKGAPPFDRPKALAELMSHMFTQHPEEVKELYLEIHKYGT